MNVILLGMRGDGGWGGGGGEAELAARTQTSHTTQVFSRSFCPNAGVQWPKFTGQLSTGAIPPSRH